VQWIAVLIGIVIGGALVAAAFQRGSDSRDDLTGDAGSMSQRTRVVLVTYLLGIGTVVVYVLLKLYMIEFPETTLVLEVPGEASTIAGGVGQATPPSNVTAARPSGDTAPAKPTAPPPSSNVSPSQALQPGAGATNATPDAPLLQRVFPQATLGSVSKLELALYGGGFTEALLVRVNGREHAKKYIGPTVVTVVPDPSELVGNGSLTIDVAHPGGRWSNALVVAVVRPRERLRLFTRVIPITREVQLLLLVLCAGLLGSWLHATRSLAVYIGNRTAIESWFWWYITQPFLGVVMALIFYAVLRGGFLTGTPADVRVVNPFGAIAVAALVGMFSDKAANKLAEVFDIFFKAEDKRGDKVGAPAIGKLDPPTVETGSPAPGDLKIVGDRLGKVTTVKFNGVDRKPKAVSDKEVVVALTPDDVKTEGAVQVAVVTSDGVSSPAVQLRVSDLKITTASLPDAPANAPYNQTLTATGGKGGNQWSVKGAPAELKLDPDTGALTGTPKTAAAHKLTVTVVDNKKNSATKTLDLKVT
jgi:hypothetical protein